MPASSVSYSATRTVSVVPLIPPLHNVERGTLKDSLTVAGGEDTNKGAGSGEPGAGFLAVLPPLPAPRSLLPGVWGAVTSRTPFLSKRGYLRFARTSPNDRKGGR